MNTKILIVGNKGVGKTALSNRLTNDLFLPYYHETIEATKVNFGINGKNVEWWDVGSQGLKEATVAYKDIDAAFVVIDRIELNDFNDACKWKLDIDRKNNKKTKTWLIINKSDLFERDPYQYDKFCHQNGFEGWIETSAKTKQGINNLMQKMSDISQKVEVTGLKTEPKGTDKKYKFVVWGDSNSGVATFVNQMNVMHAVCNRRNVEYVDYETIDESDLKQVDGSFIMIDHVNKMGNAHAMLRTLSIHDLRSKPVVLLVNKIDLHGQPITTKVDFEHIKYISCTNNIGLDGITDDMIKLCNQQANNCIPTIPVVDKLKIIVLGDPNSGITTFIHSMHKTQSNVEYLELNKMPFSRLTKEFGKSIMGAVVLVDGTKLDTIRTAQSWKKMLENFYMNVNSIILIVNKLDLGGDRININALKSYGYNDVLSISAKYNVCYGQLPYNDISDHIIKVSTPVKDEPVKATVVASVKDGDISPITFNKGCSNFVRDVNEIIIDVDFEESGTIDFLSQYSLLIHDEQVQKEAKVNPLLYNLIGKVSDIICEEMDMKCISVRILECFIKYERLL